MLILRLIPVGLAATLLLACAKMITSQTPDTNLANLAGSEWGIEGQDGPYVQFKDKGEITGSGGCNNFFGTYELNGERLIIGPLASTKKACIGPAMEQEQAFFSALQSVHHVDLSHTSLALYDENGDEVLSLRRLDWD